jgi:formiminoglutamase
MTSPRPPHATAAAWPTCRDTSFASTIRHDEPGDAVIALLGLPDDTGVELNGGRTGAASGPAAFRTALSRFGSVHDALKRRDLAVSVWDAGDVLPAAGRDARGLQETHARVSATTAWLHEHGFVVVAVGGGHDLSAPTIGALARHAALPVGGINFDAHLDVRERIGSGMPFRRLIEERALDPSRFVEIGLGRFANDPGDLEWLSEKGARLVFADEVRADGLDSVSALQTALGGSSPAFLSIDLDGLDGSVAPGVSAVNPLGLGVAHACALSEAAGREPRIRHYDIMELCPEQDPGGRTARVAALLFLHFVTGFAERPR